MTRTAVIATVILSSLLLSACREQPPRGQEQALRIAPVEVANPKLVEIGEPVSAIGRLEASDQARLAFTSGGMVARLMVDIGDTVQPGQLLAVLETTELDAAQTRASEALAKAERDLGRATELHRRGLVAREMLDNARTVRDVAAADLEAARFNRRFAEIRATAPGRVLARHVEPREVVAAGTPVLSVSSEAHGWLLRVQVADSDVLRLEAGAPAEIAFDALPGERAAARVARIAAQADAATATFEVELALEVSDPRLLSGLLGHARIAARPQGQALLVPLGALVDAGEGSARLFVAADGRAQSRLVRTGRLRADGIVVLEGLGAAEEVIVGGAAWVNDGAPVRVLAREG